MPNNSKSSKKNKKQKGDRAASQAKRSQSEAKAHYDGPPPSPTPAGLTLLAYPEQVPGSHLRVLLERQASSGGQRAGIPMPSKRPVLSLHTGSSRAFEEAKMLADMYGAVEKAKKVVHRWVSDRAGFDWGRDEAYQLFTEILEEDDKPSWLILGQHFAGPLQPHVVEGFSRIRTAAESVKKHILVLTSFTKLEHAEPLYNVANECVKVSYCEPDLKAQYAFSLECLGLRHLHPFGIGHVMAQVELKKSGVYAAQCRPFIAQNVIDRVMWCLRVEGHSLMKIGKVVGLNKSNVKHHLDALPHHFQPEMKSGWRDKYLDLFDFDALSDDTPKEADGD